MNDELLLRIDEDGSLGLYEPYAVVECETKEDYDNLVELVELGKSIVRCKDCRWLYDMPDDYCCFNHNGLVSITPDSFCGYGERREET